MTKQIKDKNRLYTDLNIYILLSLCMCVTNSKRQDVSLGKSSPHCSLFLHEGRQSKTSLPVPTVLRLKMCQP